MMSIRDFFDVTSSTNTIRSTSNSAGAPIRRLGTTKNKRNNTTTSSTKKNSTSRGGRVQPLALTKEEYNSKDFYSIEEEESFLIPKYLKAGEMEPIRWRDDLTPVDGEHCEAFVIGLPEKLGMEVKSYMDANGILDYARTMIYEERPPERGHRIYTLNDGRKWASQISGKWKTDMVWFDPADEETFESLVTMLKRGGFDQVLDSIGQAFDMNGIMIQGIGAIFLSQYEQSKNMHVDMDGMAGTFFNILFPIHIPENDTGKLYIGEYYHKEHHSKATVNLRFDNAIVIGGETLHGTGECDYRDKRDLRLLLNVYIADVETEKSLERIARDSTSLWPTYGDKEWFLSQKHRFYSRDGSTSMKFDQGRKPLHVVDKDEKCPEMEHLCEDDPDGWRLKCPKTCRVYQEDDEYYENIIATLGGEESSSLSNNRHQDDDEGFLVFMRTSMMFSSHGKLWEVLMLMFTLPTMLYVFLQMLRSKMLSNAKVHSH
jgi:hypothetical protein